MLIKSTTYTIQKLITNVMVVLVLLTAFNMTASASDYLKEDKSSVAEGSKGKNTSICNDDYKNQLGNLTIGDLQEFVLDVIVKPRSVKKQSIIAKQSNGLNAYRLLQDGRNLVFEVNTNGIIHQVKASNSLEKGETLLVSAYYQDGKIGMTINGKKPYNCFYQIDSEKLENVKLDIDQCCANKLTLLKDQSFTELSAFRKALKKSLGRKNFRKYSKEIIETAYLEKDLASIYIGKGYSFGNSQLSVESDFAGVIKQSRLLHPVRRHSAGSQVVTTLKNLQNQKLQCSSKILLATLEIDEQKQSTVKKVSTESISEGTKTLEPKLICEKCCACSNPNDQKNISNKNDAFQANYNLSSLQQAGLTIEKANSLLELKWDNASESEKVAANNSHLTYLLRNDDLTTDDQLFDLEKEWNSTFVSYVKNTKSEKYASDDTSFFVFAGIEQKVELDKKNEEQNSEIKSKKSFQEFLSRLARGEDHSKYYDLQKNELVFNSDRFNGQLLKINELQIWSRHSQMVSSNTVDARKSYFQLFDIFGQQARSFKMASLDRVKYVNYCLGKYDAFNDIKFQSTEQEEVTKIKSELAKKQFQNLSSVPEKKVIAEFLSDHNWAHQKDVFKIYSTGNHEFANCKTAKTDQLLKLNKKCSYTCLKYAHSKDNSREQITRSGICDLIYTNNPEASSAQFQLDKVEGPPDVPDKTGEYSRTYLKEPDILYGLG